MLHGGAYDLEGSLKERRLHRPRHPHGATQRPAEDRLIAEQVAELVHAHPKQFKVERPLPGCASG